MFSKVVKRLQFVTAVWSPKHLQLAELWSPFFSSGPGWISVCVCACKLKLCTNRSFSVLSEKKKQQQHPKSQKPTKTTNPQTKRKGKKWCMSEARGQSIPKHLFQNSSASAAASWLPTVATPAFLSHRAGGVWWVISRGLFPEVKSLSMASRKVAKGWERSSRSSRQSQDEKPRKTQPCVVSNQSFPLETFQIQHADTPSPYLFFSFPREGGI